MTNEGMAKDYHLAKKRSEWGYMAGWSCGAGFLLNFIILWPFENQVTWLVQGFIAAFCVAAFISAVDYEKKAAQIEKAWRQAYNRPG